VAGRLDELPELRVCHLMTVDPEAVHTYRMDRSFLRLIAFGPHCKRAAGNQHHPGCFAVTGGQPGIGGATAGAGRRRGLLLGAGGWGDHQAARKPEEGSQHAASFHRDVLGSDG
jgi:hypothetical protein